MTRKVFDRVANTTIGEAFKYTLDRFPDSTFVAVPSASGRGYHNKGFEITYNEAAERIDYWVLRFQEAGYGLGHRVAIALDNRPEHILFRLAMNIVGISCVPVNPDYRASELAYLMEHSDSVLIIYLLRHKKTIEEAQNKIDSSIQTWCFETGDHAFPIPTRRKEGTVINKNTESSLLYTSGTTGRPKGCMLSHQYELLSGAWYVDLDGLFSFRPGRERVYNPLPLYHVNSGIVSTLGMMLIGGCQIQPDRFHPRSWWNDVVETRATVIHYLGVVASMLLNQAEDPLERSHGIRLGFGAGVEPELHSVFEERFGFPLIEVWGMTEMVRVLAANKEPRKRGTRAMGKPVSGLEVEIHDDNDKPVAPGIAGEMVIRYSSETPRFGAFSGYLKDDAATERAWRGEWFHTGDIVVQATDGMLHFVDRKKNIIRRSGENISAAEVESVLQVRSEVDQVAVLAIPDRAREEEVLACIVLRPGIQCSEFLAKILFDYCNEKLAYFKTPGWIKFVDDLPKTGSQKIQKHLILALNTEPTPTDKMIDLRVFKRRD